MDKENVSRLAPPPRSVPARLRLALCIGRTRSVVGVLVFGFTMIFFWIFGMSADLSEPLYWGKKLETAEGQLISVEDTKLEINERTICVYSYKFVAPGGEPIEDYSYAPWRSDLKEGAKLTIEYPPGRLDLSRIRGMRRKPVSMWFVLFGIAPLVGLLLMFSGLKKGLKESHLLANGELGSAKLKSKTRTSMSVNDQQVYKLCFEFTASNGETHEMHLKTHETAKLTDEAEESILYDVNDPATSALLDALPSAPSVNEFGELQARASAAIAPLIIFLIVFGGHAAYLVFGVLR